ncbi:hypothetical protein F5Y17DRAFT_418097 [Xylariaceae sp. FL0594]|nr:hypothetical protein F5Y17DRAFT_418097 [Xylariaceae sp. FL0594]
MASGGGMASTNSSPWSTSNNGPSPLSAPSGASSVSTSTPTSAPVKRTRVLLSCHACRSSKLKCDRATPCGQCLKKGRGDSCAYAVRPEKAKPAKSMAARLKRLEGMVRGMVELEGAVGAEGSVPTQTEQHALGSVVHSEKTSNYVGGTHFMAILEDLEDLKAYFEDSDSSDDLDTEDSDAVVGPGEVMLLPRSQPRNKQELLALLPDKTVMDRLMNRYFNSNSPSQHTIHIPTFLKQYNKFHANRDSADVHWIAILFMVLALGVFFSSFQAPHELQGDSDMSAMSRFRKYRGACGWALIAGKYTQPGPFTLQAMILYTEGEFIANRVSQMNCYLLCSTTIRLMLKMGLHRDPSKLPRISAYEGEMRRRLWHLAVQIDLLVAFHLGLPCMINGIESDTALPRNLLDSDFDEDSAELPPSRPTGDYTPLTYAINKARISRGFGLVARLSHSLTPPTYAEVMRVDAHLQDGWSSMPSFMMVKPLAECIVDPPMLVIQRFGLAALYQKSRCVLHRRYLVEPRQLKEHAYSRRTCLEAAVALLGYQRTLSEATRPGAILAQNGWFVASLAVNDFLLANMIVALVIQQLCDGEEGDLGWVKECVPPVTRDSLIVMLKGSYEIWADMAATVPDRRKAATVVRTMLRRIETQLGIISPNAETTADSHASTTSTTSTQPEQPITIMPESTTFSFTGQHHHHNNGMEQPPLEAFVDFGMVDLGQDANLQPQHLSSSSSSSSSMPTAVPPWDISQMESGSGYYDWDQFDAMTRRPNVSSEHDDWFDQSFGDFPTYTSWNSSV